MRPQPFTAEEVEGYATHLGCDRLCADGRWYATVAALARERDEARAERDAALLRAGLAEVDTVVGRCVTDLIGVEPGVVMSQVEYDRLKALEAERDNMKRIAQQANDALGALLVSSRTEVSALAALLEEARESVAWEYAVVSDNPTKADAAAVLRRRLDRIDAALKAAGR